MLFHRSLPRPALVVVLVLGLAFHAPAQQTAPGAGPAPGSKAPEPLPQVSEVTMTRIQRLALILSLYDYPQTQTVIFKALKDYRYWQMGGKSSNSVRFHHQMALTDPRSEIGYYGIRLYLDDTEPGTHALLVTGAEVVFQPKFSEKYAHADQVMVVTMPHGPEMLSLLKDMMRTFKLTPGEFVLQLGEIGLPSDTMMERYEALSSAKK